MKLNELLPGDKMLKKTQQTNTNVCGLASNALRLHMGRFISTQVQEHASYTTLPAGFSYCWFPSVLSKDAQHLTQCRWSIQCVSTWQPNNPFLLLKILLKNEYVGNRVPIAWPSYWLKDWWQVAKWIKAVSINCSSLAIRSSCQESSGAFSAFRNNKIVICLK